jgi:hypothetical protein
VPRFGDLEPLGPDYVVTGFDCTDTTITAGTAPAGRR